MIARFVLGTIGLVLAAISLKRRFDELRRPPVRIRTGETPAAPRAVTQLLQDPHTGIYYPAD
ncbi:MAG: hypothetical protein M3N38_12535 [Pseudomonadota bacterium]|nr:hypothetical protein [Pseudomonadota bacterium]